MAAFAAPIISGFVGSLFGGLGKGHAERLKGATDENSALNVLIPALAQSMSNIFDAANRGTITPSQAVAAVNASVADFSSQLAPFQGGKGQHATACAPMSGTPNNWKWNTPCDKNCTAGCCIYCNVIRNWQANAIYVFQQGGGAANFGQIYGNKYGLQSAPMFTLTYRPGKPTLRVPNGSALPPPTGNWLNSTPSGSAFSNSGASTAELQKASLLSGDFSAIGAYIHDNPVISGLLAAGALLFFLVGSRKAKAHA